MDGGNPDARKNDPENEDPVKNVNVSSKYDLLKSRNLFRQKDRQCLSVWRCGKWLQMVRNSPKVSCEVSTSPSPSNALSKVGENHVVESPIPSYQSLSMHKKVISLSRKTFSYPSTDYYHGTLQFTMRTNETPCFVFKLENQKDIYVASLSSNVENQSVFDYSYMIHQQRGESSSSSSQSSHPVGRIKVSSTLLLGSSLNERIIERQFVLFCSNTEDPQILPHRKKNRGLSKKVVDVMKKNNQSDSKLSCFWDQHFQEPSFENNLPTNLETLAIVVKQEFIEERIGGWGLKFLRKSSLVETTRMDVVIPSGIHGGPEDGPSSLIKRWRSQGNCDCGGWDLGCSITILKGQPEKENLFELFKEGSKHETPEFRMMNVVRGGVYYVQFQRRISVLQSFSIALAYIHSQSYK